MAEITRRRTGELLRVLFDILIPQPDGMPAKEALARVAAKVKVSEYEAGTYGSGAKRLDWIIRFGTIDAVKAGWMTKAKGRWAVTEAGRAAHAKLKDPEAFCKEAVRLYKQWKVGQLVDGATSADAMTGADESGEREVSTTFEEAEERAWAEVEAYLQQLPPYDFQELVAGLLRAMGYHVAWIAPPGKDGGTDVVAFTDPLGTQPPRIKVQVKRQQQKVSVEGLRSFLGVLRADDVGIFVNTGGFTKDAEDAARNESRRVTLIDDERLFDLWIEHAPRLEERARRLLPLRAVWYLAPET